MNKEENFKLKEKHVEISESKMNSIMERLELLTKQVKLISDYLITISPAEEQWKLERYHPFKTKSR